MSVGAVRAIRAVVRAASAVCGGAMARIRRMPVGTIVVFAVALAWIGTSGWLTFVRPQPFDDRAYERYQEEVAMCRELRTSEARYDCVARALIGRDQQNFGRSLFVFVPPFMLLIGRYVWREVRATMREREHARLAELRSRQHLSKMRQEMLGERAAHIPNGRLDEEARRRRLYNPAASGAAPATPGATIARTGRRA
ncbi:MAG: hypothetical protein ACM30I_11140 [Gemmatimonas sp.]